MPTSNAVATSEPAPSTAEPKEAAKNTDLVSVWERRLQALDEALRAFGTSITIEESTDVGMFVATFPQGHAPEREHQPLVPIIPPDLEDIAFEILRQARYRRR